MAKRLSKKKKPDFSEVALRVVKEATGETNLSPHPQPTKPSHKVSKASPKKPD